MPVYELIMAGSGVCLTDYDLPVYTGLEAAGYLTMARAEKDPAEFSPCPGDRWDISIKDELAPHLAYTEEIGRRSRNYLLFGACDVEVTALTTEGDVRQAKFKKVYTDVTPVGALPSMRALEETAGHVARYRQYDDGWHCEDISPLDVTEVGGKPVQLVYR